MLLANPASGNTSQAPAPASSNTSANSANTSLNDQLLHLLKQGQAPQQTTTNQVQTQPQQQQQQGQRNPMEILQLQQRIEHLKQQQDLLQNQLQRQIDTQLDHQRRQAQQGGDVQRQQEQAAAETDIRKLMYRLVNSNSNEQQQQAQQPAQTQQQLDLRQVLMSANPDSLLQALPGKLSTC